MTQEPLSHSRAGVLPASQPYPHTAVPSVHNKCTRKVPVHWFWRFRSGCVINGAGSRAIRGIGKQPVAASHGQGPNGILGSRIADVQQAVFTVSDQLWPLVQGITDGIMNQVARFNPVYIPMAQRNTFLSEVFLPVSISSCRLNLPLMTTPIGRGFSRCTIPKGFQVATRRQVSESREPTSSR